MSNISSPEPVKNGDRIASDHKNLNDPYVQSSKRKFEGWPILWILIILLIIVSVIWYTGSAKTLMAWIEGKK